MSERIFAALGDERLAMRWVAGMLALYALSWAVFQPDIATNDDEAKYLRQAALVAEGRATVTQVDPFSGETREHYPSTYPLGTALAMAPFVKLFGAPGGYLVPLMGLLAAVWFTALWLRSAGRSPLFALLVLGFPPALVMGRVAMSDVPSAGVVALGLWLFWHGAGRHGLWWLASGFVAGASFAFRVSNPLLFAPLFAGAVLRGERYLPLVLGGALGLAVRFVSNDFFYGEALFERGQYPFQPGSVLDRLPFYSLALFVLVPGGLPLALAYRGHRRPEVLLTTVGFVAFYLLQQYSTVSTGLAKRVILALRYLIPLVPLLAFAMAESVPRIWRGLLSRRPEAARGSWRRAAGALLAASAVGLAGAAAGVHPFLHRWGASQAEIRDLIDAHVPLDAVLVTNHKASAKFVRELERRFEIVRRRKIEPAQVVELAERYEGAYVVLLDRSDSEFWRQNSAENAAFLAGIEPPPALLIDREVTPTDRLRIWRVPGHGRAGASGDATSARRAGTDPLRTGSPRPVQPPSGTGGLPRERSSPST